MQNKELHSLKLREVSAFQRHILNALKAIARQKF